MRGFASMFFWFELKKNTFFRERHMKILLLYATAACLCLYANPAAGGSPDISDLLKQLQKYGVSGKDLQKADAPLKKLLTMGTDKNDLKEVIETLGKADVKGSGMLGSLGSLSDLAEAGEKFGDSKGFLSDTVKNSGLRGPRLAEQIRDNAAKRKKRFNKTLKENKKNRQKRAENMQDALRDKQKDRQERMKDLREKFDDIRK